LSVRQLLRQHQRCFVVLAAAAVAWRLFFVFRFPVIAGDSFVYGDIAGNWLAYGVYGLTQNGTPAPTCIRLPGYPAFLAACFALFGIENYTAALVVQAIIDTATCFFVAGLALELVSQRAARLAFLLAALCPFTANYAAAALAETPSIFFSAAALYFAARGSKPAEGSNSGKSWFFAGLAAAAATLLRPDGALLAAVIGAFLAWRLVQAAPRRPAAVAAAIFLAAALLPLAPWTARNWRVFHRFQPLAPRYANAPDEFVAMGFNRWIKTWIVDFISVQYVYWHVDGEPLQVRDIPARAFDSAEQRERTERLIAVYNRDLVVTPEMDAEFARLAEERVRHAPLRYYLWLPAARVADMWLRPRTELLPLDPAWWRCDQDARDCSLSILLGAINLALLAAAVIGAWKLRYARSDPRLCMLLAFVLLRSLFLGTIENPEPRYMLECYPVVLVLAAAGLSGHRVIRSSGDRGTGDRLI